MASTFRDDGVVQRRGWCFMRPLIIAKTPTPLGFLPELPTKSASSFKHSHFPGTKAHPARKGLYDFTHTLCEQSPYQWLIRSLQVPFFLPTSPALPSPQLPHPPDHARRIPIARATTHFSCPLALCEIAGLPSKATNPR
jgi:hypothetical protein